MNKFNFEISNAFLWMVIISLIITPIAWQYKLLIMTIFMSLYHIINTGISEIKESLAEVIINQSNENKKIEIINDYKTSNVSTKIVRIILSYTNYVNNTVWHK